ncbi:ArsR/SmtB family transcription factor [Arthrobacter sp. NyZ413]|uniref:ArsR/SmtB family transcription factor n=1 Tax=Arthrobacter sp. NyZ413 TaxID=3144669 RepID=UPI003BF84E29
MNDPEVRRDQEDAVLSHARMKLAASPGSSRVFKTLLQGPRSPSEIAKALRIAPGTASNHLAHLHALGLVTSEPKGRNRIYSIPSSIKSTLQLV